MTSRKSRPESDATMTIHIPTYAIILLSSVTLIVDYGCTVLRINLDIARMMILIPPCQSIFQHHCVVVPNSSMLVESSKPVMSLFTRSNLFPTLRTHLRGSCHSPLSPILSHLSGPLPLPYGLADFNNDRHGCPRRNLGLALLTLFTSHSHSRYLPRFSRAILKD
jgi:hypothetical protein